MQGVKENTKKAFEWYLKSAELGYTDAMNALADMYESGEGVEVNQDQANNWREKAGGNIN